MEIKGLMKKGKFIKSFLTISILGLSVSACNVPSPLGSGSFNLKALMVTKIHPDRTSVSSSLKWVPVAGAEHYELSRIEDGGSEVNIGPSKIENNETSFSDPNLKEESSYKYVIRAINSNNKQISKDETLSLKPITSNDLSPAQILDLKAQPEPNRITRETTLKWSSVPNADMYYVSIINDSTSKQIFGVFTKEPKVSINETSSPINPSDLVKVELPILTGGLEKSVQHRLFIYTIKFNNSDPDKATAIGLRKSEEVFIQI